MSDPNAVQLEWVPFNRLGLHARARGHRPEELAELKASMKVLGQLQPARGRWKNETLEIFVGAGRYQAARGLSWECLLVMIVERTDEQVDLEMLHENLKREDLDPITEAKEYRFMIDTYHWSQAEMAEKAGKSQESVSESIGLLDLLPDVQDLIARAIISKGAGLFISKLTDQGLQKEAAQHVIDGRLNEDQAKELVALYLAGKKPVQQDGESVKKSPAKAAPNAMNLAALWPNLPKGVLAKVEKGWVTLRWSPSQFPDVRPVLESLLQSAPAKLLVPVSRRNNKKVKQTEPSEAPKKAAMTVATVQPASDVVPADSAVSAASAVPSATPKRPPLRIPDRLPTLEEVRQWRKERGEPS